MRRLVKMMDQLMYIQKGQGPLHSIVGPQFGVIDLLIKQPDRIIYPKDVEEHLSISKSTTSGLLKRMENNGLILIHPDSSDTRRKAIQLTSFGRDRYEEILPELRLFSEALTHNINKEDLVVFESVLDQLAANITCMIEKEDYNLA